MMRRTNKPVSSLEAQLLEDRMMLSTVSILAGGEMGDETMELVVDGQVVQSWENVGTELQEFVFETDAALNPEQIRIAFTNDFYAPDEGIDRNLTVESMTLDGTVYATDAPNVFAAGVWNNETSAIEFGFGRGQTLHTNGYFVFPAQTISSIEFAGRNWEVVEGQPSERQLFVAGGVELALSGEAGPLAVSTKIDVEGGERYRLTLDAKRLLITGPVGANGPWSTIGINYYSQSGQLLSQEFIEVNDDAGFQGDRIFDAPDAATDAYLWAWIDGHSVGTINPLRIRDIDWKVDDTVVPEDNTPPEAGFNSFTFETFNQFSINFGVDFSDNQELAVVRTGVIAVTDPAGNVSNPGIAFGPPTNTDTFQTLVFTMPAPNGDVWGVADNGEYTITLVDSQLSDAAGNLAAGRELGTLTVDIAVPEDTTPPVVELTSSPGVITSPPTGGRGRDVEFVVTYTDNVAVGGFEDLVQDRILVEGPNGYSGFGRGIAGGGLEPNGFFEITYIPLPSDGFWGANENGQYTITLLDETVFDELGNATPGRQLGTFEVQIPGIEVG